MLISGTGLESVAAAGPSRLVRSEANPVLDPRAITSPSTGSNSVVAIFDPCVVWDSAADTWRVYWTFFDALAEENRGEATGIMGGSSADGTAVEPYEQLSLRQQGTFDTSSVETCDVVIVDAPDAPAGQRYYMYYSGSVEVKPDPDIEESQAIYRIGLAISEDGVSFEPLSADRSRGGVPGLLFGTEEALGGPEVAGNFVTDPTVLIRDGIFHMWTLCIKRVPDTEAGICHHTSTDGIDWEHQGLTSGLDRAFPIQPTGFLNPSTGRFEMYVVMDTPEEESQIHDAATNLGLSVTGWFHATSDDGQEWTLSDSERAFSADISVAWEDLGLATGADAEIKDGTVYFFYPSLTTIGGSVAWSIPNWPLNLATGPAQTGDEG